MPKKSYEPRVPTAKRPFRIYVAAPWEERSIAKWYAEHLEIVTDAIISEKWWEDPRPISELSDVECQHIANVDLQAVASSDLIIVVQPLKLHCRGGMHVEAGYALAKGKRVVSLCRPGRIVGELPIFYYLCPVYSSIEDIIQWELDNSIIHGRLPLKQSATRVPPTDAALNPGSPRALKKGCTCPVLDNNRGRGFKYGDGGTCYYINEDCPLHGSKMVCKKAAKKR